MNPQVGAASTHVRDLLGTVARTGVVRHVGHRRIGVEVSGRVVVLDGDPGPRTLPCAVVVPALEPAQLARLGEPVVLDAHALRFGGGTVRLVRWWEPARVRAGSRHSTGRTASRTSRDVAGLDDAVRSALVEGACRLFEGRAEAAATAVSGVLGHGQGSTPDADDAVAGLLLAARAHLPASRRTVVEAAARIVADAAPARTTALSAELLRAVTSGAACAVVVDHLRGPSAASAAAVRALGASSGAATLAGIDLLVAAVSDRTVVRKVAA